jgi:hypothetical protein
LNAKDSYAGIKVGEASTFGVSPATIQSFYKRNWNKRIALSDPGFYAWQFVNNPINSGIDECVVALKGGTLCGVMGVNSRSFYLNGNRVNGAELTTWIVSEDVRGKGAGPGILNYLLEKYDVLIGMGISRDALPIYLRLGFKYLRSIPRYLRLFNPEGIAEYSVINALGIKLAKLRSAKISSNPYTTLQIDDGALDMVFHDFSKKYQLFDRGSVELRWRYTNHPVYRYESHLIVDKQSNKKAIVVTRHQELPNEQVILRVMDIFGDDEALLPAAAFIDSYCIERKYALADFFCTTTKISSKLIAAGWFSALDEEFFQFPHLFEPIELRAPSSTSLVYWARHELEKLADYSTLYITKQDADLDRPVYVGD